MRNPYQRIPSRQFWRSAVAEQAPELTGIYRKKFEISPSTGIATAGSCFAQHIAVHMKNHGYNVLDVEPPPRLPIEVSRSFGYLLYSGRYGNIYTARQLLQLAQEAVGLFTPQDYVWAKDGRYFDALRPSVEPNGLGSPAEVVAHRADHVRRFRKLLCMTDIFVFTLGLTEAWYHKASGTVYPTAPGTIAGEYDPETVGFANFTFSEVQADLLAFRKIAHELNSGMRFILTVSPVPLTATATDQHALSATVRSKSVLRAVAGQLYEELDDVDYFPSFELVGTPFTSPHGFDGNLRTVSSARVESVMRVFLKEHGALANSAPAVKSKAKATRGTGADVVCEEQLLDAFAQ